MFKVNKSIEAGKWFPHPDDPEVQFKIRPTSIYSLKRAPGDLENFTLDDIVQLYIYSLMDWKGIGDENGKPLKCDDESKMAFLNQHDDVATFVINKASEIKTELNEAQESKNLSKSQSGETPKSEKPVAKSVSNG